MSQAVWGADPEFFGPRHAHREQRIVGALAQVTPPVGLHLECAAGVGSLSLNLARRGVTVIAADASLRSLGVVLARSRDEGFGANILPVVADITCLPFSTATFATATTAETLEHISDDALALSELQRVLCPSGWVVGTVPAGPEYWSEWDDWACHHRRYTREEMLERLTRVGLTPQVTYWGWPFMRLYDRYFMKYTHRHRQQNAVARSRAALLRVAKLGQHLWLVRLVRALFAVDRLFDGCRWGTGLLIAAQKPVPTGSAAEAPEAASPNPG